MIYSFIYIFITAASMVLVQDLDATMPPMFLLFMTTVIAAIYFNALNFRSLKSMYVLCWAHKKLWFSMMLSVLVMRAGAMIAPGIVGASLYAFLYFAWLGALGFFALGLKDRQKNQSNFYCALSITALIIITLVFKLDQPFTLTTLFGLACSLISGTSAFVYFKQSKAVIQQMNMPATQILAVRFYLTIPVAFFLIPAHSFVNHFTINDLGSVTLLAFVSMIIPLYFSQKALEIISSELNAIIMSLCPALSGALQEILFHDVKLEEGIIYIAYGFVLSAFYLIGKFRKSIAVNA